MHTFLVSVTHLQKLNEFWLAVFEGEWINNTPYFILILTHLPAQYYEID